jgi:hypothetical protein
MTAIAECYIVPRAALPKIRDAALPKKPLIGKPRDTFFEVLQSSSVRRVEYGWSGYVIVTLLVHLEENGANLMVSSEDELAKDLSEKRQATFFILTDEHRRLLPVLDPAGYDEVALQAYYERFNETQADGVGRAMLDGVVMLRDGISALDDDTAGILFIG